MDGVHYAVRFKGKFHIIINKVFFSTIIFNPNAFMHIDHSFQKFISTVILDLKALYFLLEQIGKANLKLGKRETEVECCFICKALRVCWYIQNLWVNKFYYAGFDLTNDQLTNIVLLDFQLCWVKFLRKKKLWIMTIFMGCCDLGPHTVCLKHVSMSKANIGG